MFVNILFTRTPKSTLKNKRPLAFLPTVFLLSIFPVVGQSDLITKSLQSVGLHLLILLPFRLACCCKQECCTASDDNRKHPIICCLRCRLRAAAAAAAGRGLARTRRRCRFLLRCRRRIILRSCNCGRCQMVLQSLIVV